MVVDRPLPDNQVFSIPEAGRVLDDSRALDNKRVNRGQSELSMKMNWFAALAVSTIPAIAFSQVAVPPPHRTKPWQLPVALRLAKEPKLANFYTLAMRQRKLQGAVELDLRVDPNGSIVACEVKTSTTDPELAAASCRAAQTARFQKSAYGAPAMPLKFIWNTSNPQVIAARPGHPARLATPPFSGEFSYPVEAEQRNEQGRAFADIDVSPEGRPTACRIRRSSGSALLDAATCHVMMTLGRYEPAVDVFGIPSADTANGVLNWRIPQASPAPSPSQS